MCRRSLQFGHLIAQASAMVTTQRPAARGKPQSSTFGARKARKPISQAKDTQLANAMRTDTTSDRESARDIVLCGLTFELSGPEPAWCLGREAEHKPEEPRGPSAMPVEVRLERRVRPQFLA